MRRIAIVFNLVLAVTLLGAAGCCTTHKSDSTVLQGTWTGKEIGGHSDGPCKMIFAGQAIEFHGPDESDKGTFTLREDVTPRQIMIVITDCPAPKYIGKTSHCIYRLDGGVLTISGNEPGIPDPPAAFDAPGARHFVFKKGE